MDSKAVLFSLQNGFWSSHHGWVNTPFQADKQSLEAKIQINFKNVSDVFSIPMSAIYCPQTNCATECFKFIACIFSRRIAFLDENINIEELTIEILQKKLNQLDMFIWDMEHDNGLLIIDISKQQPIEKAPIQAPYFTPCQKNKMIEKEREKNAVWRERAKKREPFRTKPFGVKPAKAPQ